MSSASIIPGPALARALAREQAVLHLRRVLGDGMAREKALIVTAKSFGFSASVSAVRRWEARYTSRGFLGLTERKIGRVGRKRKGLT
jgi:hypothetical protein